MLWPAAHLMLVGLASMSSTATLVIERAEKYDFGVLLPLS